MAKWIGINMFVIVFAGICLIGNYYILSRLFAFFQMKHHFWFWLVLAYLAFGYIAVTLLERRFPAAPFEWLLRVSALGLGIGWLCLVVLLPHDLLFIVFRFPIAITRWIVLAVIGGLVLYALVNALRIDIKTVTVSAPLQKKIVQLSDIHRGSVSRHHLRRLVRKTNKLNPDLVLITGDLLDPAGRLAPASVKPLEDLTAPIYWITGNHERYAGLGNVTAVLKETPVIPLRNEVIQADGIQLIGIDDSEDAEQVQRVLPQIQIEPDPFTVLMYHRPDGADVAAKAGVDLMLSGHTHNGQIWPFNWIVRSKFNRIEGVFEIDGMTLHVSPGSGTWGPPMRLGSRNQITLIHLKKND